MHSYLYYRINNIASNIVHVTGLIINIKYDIYNISGIFKAKHKRYP